jgi:uncharacterized protein YkwD
MDRRIAPVHRIARALLLLLLNSCIPAPAPPASAPVGTHSSSLIAIEQELHERINAHRSSRGLPPLQSDAVLTSFAREHSEKMARGERPFGHVGFEERVQAVRAAQPVSTVSENVAINNYPAEQVASRVLSGWLRSSGHRQNLESNSDLTGVGVARGPSGDYFITQLYAATHRR